MKNQEGTKGRGRNSGNKLNKEKVQVKISKRKMKRVTPLKEEKQQGGKQ